MLRWWRLYQPLKRELNAGRDNSRGNSICGIFENLRRILLNYGEAGPEYQKHTQTRSDRRNSEPHKCEINQKHRSINAFYDVLRSRSGMLEADRRQGDNTSRYFGEGGIVVSLHGGSDRGRGGG